MTPTERKVDVLAEYRAFLAERARLSRNPDVQMAYEKAENRFNALDTAVAALIEAASRLERKAIEQSRTTSSVFTSDIASLRVALASVQGGP